MDIQQLCAVLQGCLSPDREQRSQAEALLKQHETAKGQLVNLLCVAGEPSVDLAVRQVASISFKQTAKRHWEPEKEGAPCLVCEEDKQLVRGSLLDAIISAPHVIQSQLQEVLGAVVYSDYPEAWPGLLEGVMGHLTSNDQPRMYGGLVALRVLARKYEFKDDEERAPLDAIIAVSFPVLLPLMQQLLAAPPTSNQVPEFIKLTCKIFWSTTFMHIPSLLLQPEQFQGWMLVLHTALTKQLPWDQAPSDPSERRKWPWAKAQKWVMHNTYRLFNRYGEPRLCNEGNDMQFAKMFEAHVSAQFLQDQLAVLAPLAAAAGSGAGGSSRAHVPPRVVHLALQHLTRALELKGPYKQLKPHVEGLLGGVVLPALCFDDEDAELWEEDPQEFVRKGYDVLEDMMSPRTAAANFITTLAQKRKTHLPWLMGRLVQAMNAYGAAAKASGGSVPPQLAREMDGALMAIGALADTLKAKDPYRSQLESLLGEHVAPLFASPHHHLRAKAAWLAKEFADIPFTASSASGGGAGGKGPLFNALLQAVINSLSDGELPVRVEAAMALRSFIDELDDVGPLTPILPQLMDSIFKLMGEVENEDLVFTLETMVEKFGDSIAPYAVNLAQNLTAAFWKYSGMAAGADEEDEADDDMAAVAAYGCLKALNTLLDAVCELKHLLPALEDIVHPIMAKCISADGQDVLEDVLELLGYFTYFGELTPRLWALWPQLHAVALDFGVEYWDNLLIPLDNFVSRGTQTYLTSTNPNYQESLYQMVAHTLNGDFEELNMIPPVKLMAVVLQNCSGQVDQWLQPYLQLALAALGRADSRLLKDELLVLLANCLYYNPAATLGLLQQCGAVQQLFTLWFGCIFERRKGGTKPAHFRSQSSKKQVILGLLGLLGNTPDAALPPEVAAGLPQLLGGLVRLLSDLKEQQEAAEAAASEEEEEEDEDVGADEGEDEPAVGGDEDGGDDADLEEDEAYMKRLRKAALRMLKGEQPDDEDDDSEDEWSDDADDLHAVGSPLDDMDPFVSFAEVLGGLQASMPGRYAALVAGADPGVLAALQAMSAHAAAIQAKQAAEQQR